MFNLFNKDKGPGENQAVRKLLSSKLRFDGFYWYPLHAEPKAEIIEYFEAECFEESFGVNKLKTIIKKLGYNQLWEITEMGNDYLILVDELFGYSGTETLYCGIDAEWAVYFSHENTVTFAGEPIVSALKSEWVDWRKYQNPWN